MANILIFEDDFTLAESWQTFLVAEGHQVVLTANFDAAMSAIQKGSVDIALIDIFIREGHQPIPKGGNKLISSIQTLTLARKPWLIAVSGRSHDPGLSVLDNAQQLGADEYLKKPIDIQELVTVVNRVAKAQTNEH